MQKNIKKLILLVRFYLNLGKKLKVHFSTPREWKCLKWWGPSCECPTTALGSKFICLGVSNISKTFCFENAGNKQHDLGKKKKNQNEMKSTPGSVGDVLMQFGRLV